MANHYQYYVGDYQNVDRKGNKVYVNPNYNRPENVPSSMYFNPNFPHTPNLYQHIQHHKDQGSKPNIHVNPNFIRNTNPNNQSFNSVAVNNTKPVISTPPITFATEHFATSKEQTQESNLCQAPSMQVTKSRYCFVRQKEDFVTKTPTSRVTTTVKVNKYKTVSLNVVKRNLAMAKPIHAQAQAPFSNGIKYTNSSKPITPNTHNTRFKFIKLNTALNQPQIKHLAVRRPSLLNKSILSRKKNSKALMKKNNIPCPLFKKYGKCLRKIRGHCEYLHDKKHVSICRKFLKGICHDIDCLLSHDLTDKKMPTCFFYLQGACTKESCPYLHVKLNEKAKICLDFLKGYCEKGDKCLYRHCADKATKKKHTIPHNTGKGTSVVKVKRKKSLTMYNRENSYEDIRNSRRVAVEQNPGKEPRYYVESIEGSGEMCDIIKPSRIKLGTLPSFIQL